MEILHTVTDAPVEAVLFDFDGTISTLRYGWEAVMRDMMLELLRVDGGDEAALARMVDDYIEESTGIQTIFQMKWLAARVRELAPEKGLPDDAWWYKDEYNRRLMRTVAERVEAVSRGACPREAYLIDGAEAFLAALRSRGVACYVASGTDDADVRREARALGVEGPMPSPSFTIMLSYSGRVRVHHFDLYRLGDAEEFYAAGLDEWFGGEDVCLVEWPEMAQADFAPCVRATLSRAQQGGDRRTITLETDGVCVDAAALERWRKRD